MSSKTVRLMAVFLAVLVVVSGIPLGGVVAAKSTSTTSTATTFDSVSTSPVDLTTFTESDSAGSISVPSSSTVEANSLSTGDNSSLYKNVGNGNKSRKATFNVNVTGGEEFGQWATGYSTNTNPGFSDHEYFSGALVAKTSTGVNISAYSRFAGEVVQGNKISVNTNTTLYLTLTMNRENNSVTLKVYSDSSRSTLVGTSTSAFAPSKDYGTLYAMQSLGDSTSYNISGQVSNIEIGNTTKASTPSDIVDFKTFENSSATGIESTNNTLIVDDDGNTDASVLSTADEHVPQTGNATLSTSFTPVDYTDTSTSETPTRYTGFGTKRGHFDDQSAFAGFRVRNYQGDFIWEPITKYGTSGYYKLKEGETYYSTISVNHTTETLVARLYDTPAKNNLLSEKKIQHSKVPFDVAFASASQPSGQEITVQYNEMDIDAKNGSGDGVTGVDLSTWTIKNDNTDLNFPNEDVAKLNALTSNSPLTKVYNVTKTPANGTNQIKWAFTHETEDGSAGWQVGWSSTTESWDAGGPFAGIEWGNLDTDSSPEIHIFNKGINESNPAYVELKANTRYFASLRMDKTEEEVEFRLYSDKARTNLVANQTAPYNTTVQYDVTWALQPEAAEGKTIEGTLRNFRFNQSQTSLSGRVLTQDGTPVANATVKILGVDYSKLNLSDPDKLDQKAKDLIQQAKNPIPDVWNGGRTLQQIVTTAKTKPGGKYVAVHPLQGGVPDIVGSETKDVKIPEWGNVLTRVPAGDKFAMTVRDADTNPWLQDGVDSKLPGIVVDDTNIVVEQLGPGGSVIETYTLNTISTFDVDGGSAHDYVVTRLPPGFYRVYPEESKETSYPIVVGKPKSIAAGFAEDLNDTAEDYSKRADYIRDRLNNGKFQMTTVTTNATGHWNATVGSRVETVAVTAYKGPLDELKQDPVNVSKQDIRKLYKNQNITSSVYYPSAAKRAHPPEKGVTVRVHEQQAPSYMNVQSYQDILGFLQEFLANNSFSEIPAFIQGQIDKLSDKKLDDLYLKLAEFASGNSAIRERCQEISGCSINTDDVQNLDTSELESRIQGLQQTITELRSTIPSGNPTSSTVSDTVSLSFPFESDIDPSQVMVFAHMSNGTTKVLDASSQYVSVSDETVGSGSTVKVKNYPLGQGDAKVAKFEAKVATKDGIGDSSKTVTNPSFDGDVPGLDAVHFSSLLPKAGDQVRMTLHPSKATSYRNLTSATVYSPTGQTISSTIVDARTVKFTPETEGVHTVEATFQTPGGENWTLTQRLKVGGKNRDLPPGIRLDETPYGSVAVTGDGVEAGGVAVRKGGQEVTVTGRFNASGDIPTEPVHVYSSGLDISPDSSVNVRLVRGEDRTSISQHKRVILHLPKMPSNGDSGVLDGLTREATYYRNGEPFSPSGSKYGKVQEKNGSLVIKTVTDDQGEVTITTNSNPGLLESMKYEAQLTFNDIQDVSNPLPSVDFQFSGMPFSLVAGLGFAAGARRRTH